MMLVVTLLVALCVVSRFVSGNVIGVDFGGDSFKVSVVQPGAPFEIVTNFQSKRKTPTSISFYRDERMFGSDSIALMARKPELTFSKIYRMLGRPVNHPHIVELAKQYFPHEIYSNETTGVTCVKQENAFYSPEELIAMLLQHIQDMTTNFGGHVIKDCVITVPSYFTHHERKALYTAAEIADFRVLTLIEENTAAAVQYGMDRVFDTPTTVVFYNLGASSVQVLVVSYSSYPAKEGGKNKTIGQFDVLGKAWDSSLGSFNFDLKLADIMAKRFNEVWNKKASGKGKDVRDFVRPMTRLRIEAVKIKEILSANAEYPIKIEQLHGDTDLITKLTRADYETECAELFSKLTEPIDKALQSANITLSNVHAIELLGGGVRVPKIKKILDDYFKGANLEIGQHLNGDEAMALGAAFRAANLSTSFKVRKVGQSDVNNFGISVNLETLPKTDIDTTKSGIFNLFSSKDKTKQTPVAEEIENTEKWSKVAEIFPAKLALPSKIRTVTFPYDQDVLCQIEYTHPNLLPPGTDATIAVFNITGVTQFANEAAKRNGTHPKVHISLSLDSDGIVSLVKAEATSDLPEVQVGEDVDANETAKESATPASASASEEGEKGENKTIKTSHKKDHKKGSNDNVLRRSLTMTENVLFTHPSHWTPALIAESRLKLRTLKDADNARMAKEAALNELEGYIYKVKNRFADEEKDLSQVSNESQREAVLGAAKVAEEWLEEANSQTTTIAEYKAKLSSVQQLSDPIFHRLTELTDRPAAIAKLQQSLAKTKSLVNHWPEKFPQINKTETEQMEKAIKKVEGWIESKQEKQLSTSPFDTPVFDSSEVPGQLKPVQVLFERLIRKPRPQPEKVKVNITKSANESNATINDTIPDVNAETDDLAQDHENATVPESADKDEKDEL